MLKWSSAAAIALLAMASVPARAGSDPYIAEIDTFGSTFCPQGFLPLDGRLLTIADYETLFSLLGTTFGGDGQQTFGLPKAQRIAAAGGSGELIQCIAVYGIFPRQN